MSRRAVLCVPGTEPTKIAKVMRLAVDEVVVDLEDAVAIDRKDEARRQVQALEPRANGLRVAVRVNAMGTAWFEQDVAACAANPAVASIVVPKVESASDLAALSDVPLGIQALIESPVGVVNVHSIATASPRLEALIIGYADLAASTGRRPHASWQFVQDAVLLAARVAGIDAVDGPYLGLDSGQAFQDVLMETEALGFDGKWVIHPRQAALAQETFTPSTDELTEAAEILRAMEEARRAGSGAVAWRGRMLDEAVAVAARRVLARGAAL